MAWTWPAPIRRARPSARLSGELALGLLLAVSLGLGSQDTAPVEAFVYTAPPPPSGISELEVSGNNLSGKPGHVYRLPVVAPAPPPQARIPTAAPVQLLIPLLDVHRAVEKVGVDASGLLVGPVNAWNAGWYRGSPVPGAPGDAVIEGHAGYPGQPMIFGKLITLKPGDPIIVVLADKTRRLFLVVSSTSVPAGSAPPGFADPYGLPRLTLVTCAGHFDKKAYWYSDRLVVEARYAGLA